MCRCSLSNEGIGGLNRDFWRYGRGEGMDRGEEERVG